MKIKDINNFSDLKALTRTKGFKAMLIIGLAKKLALLAVWLLPELF
jgi:hypothetical protein